MKRLVPAITLASLAALPVGGAVAPRARQCPVLSVSCPETVMRGTPVTFTLNISGGPDDLQPAYKWTVSVGTIASGQDTSSITVDTTEAPYITNLTATADVGGLPKDCVGSASCTTSIMVIIDHFKDDEYGNLRWGDEKARLDNFAIELQNDPSVVGFLVGYGGRRSRRGEAARRLGRAKRYLVAARGIAADRVVTIDGGYREELTLELWANPKDAPPAVSPTVDPTEVEFIKPAPRRSTRRR